MWESRFYESNNEISGLVSLDGFDFQILEQRPFSRKWYSHKHNGPGIRYEIGLCVKSGEIVWCHGGYPCCDWPDLKIARDVFIHNLEEDERCWADLGYRDRRFFISPNRRNSLKHKTIMSRHETVNKRIRQFNILKHRYRHNLRKHPKVFRAIVNITQIVITIEEPLFDISFEDTNE